MNCIKFLTCICFVLINIGIGYSQFGEIAEIEDQYKNELIQLARNQIVKDAFQTIKEQSAQITKDHIYLNEIPAPPFKEEKRAQAFKEMLTAIGVDSIWIDKVGNVVALRKGEKGKRTIALDAHLDTVFPEGTDVSVKIKQDTLFAPGIGDDTRGLANVIAVIRTLNQHEIKTADNILIVGSVGEEGLGDLRGVKYLFEHGPKIDSWIAIDGGRIGGISNQGLGSHRYRITYKGPGGHSWGAFGLANPHHALGKAISLFVERADVFTSKGTRTSYNVGVIKGGTSVNSIPFESSMEIDMRSESPVRLDSIDMILQQAVQDALVYQNGLVRNGALLTVDIDMIGNRPSGELSSSLPLVQRAMAATALFGKVPRLRRGSTNSNTPISLGIPAVTIGRGGSSGKAHSLDEWWYDDEGYKAIQLTLLLLLSETGIVN